MQRKRLIRDQAPPSGIHPLKHRQGNEQRGEDTIRHKRRMSIHGCLYHSRAACSNVIRETEMRRE